jgi:hypothetical protein
MPFWVQQKTEAILEVLKQIEHRNFVSKWVESYTSLQMYSLLFYILQGRNAHLLFYENVSK